MPAAEPAQVSASGLTLVVALVLLYLLPSLIAVLRGSPRAGRLARANLVLGWSGVGWILVLAFALTDRPRRR